MTSAANLINTLKEEEAFFAAGAMAFKAGHDDSYGCHLGMRSTRDAAIRAYKAGWAAAEKFAAAR